MNRICNSLRAEYRRWYGKLIKTDRDDVEKKNYINDILVDIEDQMREECGDEYVDKISESFKSSGLYNNNNNEITE